MEVLVERMSGADPWSWGGEEGSAAESDQWNNGWGSSSQQLHHPPVGQSYWGDPNHGEGERGLVHRRTPPKVNQPQQLHGRSHQRNFPPSNNNVLHPSRTDVENSEIAPPDTFNKFGAPQQSQRYETTKSPPLQQQLKSRQPLPPSAASYFNQRPPEPMSFTHQEAFQPAEQLNPQQQPVNQQNFFNQFSQQPPANNNNNQDFFQQYFDPSTSWNGTPKNHENEETRLVSEHFNNQNNMAVDISVVARQTQEPNRDEMVQEHFNNQNLNPQDKSTNQNQTPIKDSFSVSNDQVVTSAQNSVSTNRHLANSVNHNRNQSLAQDYFSVPASDQGKLFSQEEAGQHAQGETVNSVAGHETHSQINNETVPVVNDFATGDSITCLQNQSGPIIGRHSPSSQPSEISRQSSSQSVSIRSSGLLEGQDSVTQRHPYCPPHSQESFMSQNLTADSQGCFDDERSLRQSLFLEDIDCNIIHSRLDGEGHADGVPLVKEKSSNYQNPSAFEVQGHSANSGNHNVIDHVEIRDFNDPPVNLYPIRNQEREGKKHVGSSRNLSVIDGHEDFRNRGKFSRNQEEVPVGFLNPELLGHGREKSLGEEREHGLERRQMRGEGQEKSIDGSRGVPESSRGKSLLEAEPVGRDNGQRRNIPENREEVNRRGEGQEMQTQSGLPEEDQDWGSWDVEQENSARHERSEFRKHEHHKSSSRFSSSAQPPQVTSAFRKYEAANREGEGESSPPPARGPAAGHSPSPPRRPLLPDNQENLPDISAISTDTGDGGYPLDRNQYLETSQLSSQTVADSRQSRHFSSGHGSRGSGGEREIEGEADCDGRIVVGGGRKQPVHSTPVHGSTAPASSPQLQGPPSQPGQTVQSVRPVDDRSELSVLREGGIGDGDEYRPHRSSSSHHHHQQHRGPSTSQQGPRGSNRSHHTRHRPPSSHRESSYDDDDDEYSSDRGLTRSRRHRPAPSASTSRSVVQSSEYQSDEEHEYDHRRNYHRDRRRDRDYSPEYSRRDAYRGRRETDYYDRRGYPRQHDFDERDNYRPSSRGGSDYRPRKHRPPPQMDPMTAWIQYYSNASGYGLSSSRDYEYNQEYFEMLRRSNPLLYAYWYNNYMAKINASNDRASVHSGQSGRGCLLTTERAPSAGTPPARSTDATRGEESVDAVSVDYTIRLFTTAHARGTYDSLGRLVCVDPHEPMDGQSASVVLYSVDQAVSSGDHLFAQFLEYPGPFIPNITHRTTVLQYLKRQSDLASLSSEKLLYDLVHLTLKSNGAANVSDVAELLMESYNDSMERRKRGRSGSGASGSTSTGGNLVEDNVPAPTNSCTVSDPIATLDGFRDILQQGDKSQALEWAMNRNLWGHALLLSSKMDARTHQTVTARFSSSLSPSDPLQTLYQLMSGLIPQAASSCGDSKWCDWRPHLAMMLSNCGVELVNSLGENDAKSPLVDLTCRSVLVMGDTLASRGRYYAAHFCYLVARVGFGSVGEPGSRLFLLGASPERLEYTNYKSMMLTMSYEYAVHQADSSFSIKSLQRYKALAAWRLAEAGKSRVALQYCEAVARDALRGVCDSEAVLWAADLAQHLEALDSHGDERPDWLLQLLSICDSLPQDETPLCYSNQPPPTLQPSQHTRFQQGLGTEESVDNIPRTSNEPETVEMLSQTGPVMMQPGDQMMQLPVLPNVITQPLEQPPLVQQSLMPSTPQHHPTFQPMSQPSQLIANGYQEAIPDHNEPDGLMPSEPDMDTIQPSAKSKSYFEVTEQQFRAETFGGDVRQNSQQQSSRQPPSSAPVSAQNEKKLGGDSAGSSGWLGSIMGKLSLRPKNQMILPDDTDPKIVYDMKSKKWVNTEGAAPAEMQIGPPPAMTVGHPGGPPPSLQPGPIAPGSMMNAVSPASVGGSSSLPPTQIGHGSIMPTSAPIGPGGPSSLPAAAAPSANKYKLQKGKSMKSNYVSVLGGSSVAKPSGQLPQTIYNPSQHPAVAEADGSGGYREMANIPMETQQPVMFNSSNFGS